MKSVYKLGNERGMTLVEVMVILLIVSLVLFAVPISLRSSAQVWDMGNRHNEILQNALVGMEELTRELRQAKEIIAVSQPSDPNGYIEFKYEYDIDGDGDVLDSSGDKEYKYQRYEYNETDDYLQHAWSNSSGTDLSGSLSPLAGPINSFTFTCYKELEQPAAIPGEIDQIRSIHIKMITYDDQGKENPIPLSARIYLRTWTQYYMAEDFALFGDDGVGLGDQPLDVGFTYFSNVGANGDITIGNNTLVNGEIHHGAGGELTAGTTNVTLGPDYGYDEVILMPRVSDFADEEWWGGAPPVSKGDFKVNAGAKVPIEPGVYDDLILLNNSTLDLVAGTYWFSSIQAKNKIYMNFNVSGGDIRVFIDGVSELGNKLDADASFTGSIIGGGAESVYFESHYVQDYAAGDPPAWEMGQNSVWYGAIYTPYGDIDVTDGLIYGQLISGGTVAMHGGSPTKVGTLTGNTTIDFVLSNHIDTYGSQGLY